MAICHYLLFLPFIPTIKHPLTHKTRTFTSQISTNVLMLPLPAKSAHIITRPQPAPPQKHQKPKAKELPANADSSSA